MYLATVIDCFSKMVVGFATADHMRTGLVTDALQAAIDAGGIQLRMPYSIRIMGSTPL
ncbi:hypothetical protein [Candidatus Neomicrothrix sp.]|uniref:hypothetical protein n=1 Tax=Candidatus Neomicrothrix sp. TaxID=2719034 RepID=UPI003CD0D0DE